ncbi:hypothetical protein N3K66_000703 [Trichothecium roseum]|uniref:Uncharacterized protein n=1 Tax=Trichothecium roseum TaxID=47278 RepID=A0ACC0VCZ9_9HYPO|nr:hypothetical protein N3K66_000703 [Trichothecium roseum]
MSSFLRQKANQVRSLVRPRKRLDALSGPKGQRARVVDPELDAGHCYTHMCLLEKFAWERRRLTKLAAERGFDERLLWVYYVNAARDRFVAWMRASLRRNVEGLVPPLDVALVWYSLMQDPVQWARIADIIGTRVVSWKWSSENIISSVLGHSDLLAKIGEAFPLDLDSDITSGSTISTVGAASGRPVDYLTPNHVFTVEAAGNVPRSVPFNVHAAVDRHLDYARETLRHSWHRMPGMTNRRHAGDFLGGAVARYAKFMTLVSSWAALKTLPPFDGPDCFLWPAPDVELVWRTHMLSAPEFGAFSAGLRWVRRLPAPLTGSGGSIGGSGRREDGRTSEMREAAVRVHEDRQRLDNISVEIDGSQKQKQQSTLSNDGGTVPARPPSSPGVPVVKPAAARQPLEDPYLASEEERIAAKEWEAKVLPTPAEHWFRQDQDQNQDQDDFDDGGVGQGAAMQARPSTSQESLSEYAIFARYLTEELGGRGR